MTRNGVFSAVSSTTTDFPGARTGSQYLRGLDDGRRVVVSGRFVRDVATDEATAGMARELAGFLDAHGGERELDLAGGCLPRAYSLAATADEVAARGRAFEAIARRSGGLLGRSPDFLATIVASWAGAADHFGPFADHVRDYWRESRDRHRVLTHAISDPPRGQDRAAGLSRTVRIVREDGDGIVVRGTKMLATLAPFADELLVYPYRPLGEEEAAHAVSFAVPVATPGLTLYCRPSLADGGPLASRFDEMDALCVFDDVVVPWRRVFIAGDREMANTLRAGTEMTAYAWHQSSVRAWVKAEFLFAVADRCARAAGRHGTPTTRGLLGELAGMAETLRALVIAAEAGAHKGAGGHQICDLPPLACAAMINSGLYPRAVEILQMVGSSGLVMHPSPDDDRPSSAAHEFYSEYFSRDTFGAAEHARLLRIASDLALDRFGGRQALYERVFVGPPDAFAGKFLDIYTAARGADTAASGPLTGISTEP
jgi:aromatic ring hydroxylase